MHWACLWGHIWASGGGEELALPSQLRHFCGEGELGVSHFLSTDYVPHNKAGALFFLIKIYLFIHERHRERGRDTGRGRSRLPAGSPMWDSIPGLQDHTLSRKVDALTAEPPRDP